MNTEIEKEQAQAQAQMGDNQPSGRWRALSETWWTALQRDSPRLEDRLRISAISTELMFSEKSGWMRKVMPIW